MSFIQKIKGKKITGDLLWNYFALSLLAASGLIVNFFIAYSLGNDALGIFNQCFAIYLVASQFAVGGVHYSVLRSTSQYENDIQKRSEVLFSGIFVSLPLGILIACVLYWSRGSIGEILESSAVSEALLGVALAVPFVALNKIQLAYLNGRESMRWYAFGQSARYLSLMISVVAIAYITNDPRDLPYAFFISELLVTLLLTPPILRTILFPSLHSLYTWIRHHIVFGTKGFVSGILLDLNTRVDVLMIGFFLGDGEVGLYSLAATVAEGMYQLLVVVKNQLNPRLAKVDTEDDKAKIQSLFRRCRKYIYPSALTVLLGLIGVFYLVITLFLPENDPLFLCTVLAILGGGFMIASAFIPFDAFLLQGGYPGTHTFYILLIVISNIVLNFLFIPLFGLYGAAAATASATVLGIFYLCTLVKIRLGVLLW